CSWRWLHRCRRVDHPERLAREATARTARLDLSPGWLHLQLEVRPWRSGLRASRRRASSAEKARPRLSSRCRGRRTASSTATRTGGWIRHRAEGQRVILPEDDSAASERIVKLNQEFVTEVLGFMPSWDAYQC